MSMIENESPLGLENLRVIPIVKPGVGYSFALARSGAEETAARNKADALGLRSGSTMQISPGPEVWALIDYLKRR
jgi:hypothetical protein